MAAKTDVAGRRIKKAGEPALASYVDKGITPVTQDYIDWLKAETGYDVDPMSVQLSSVLRGTFQKSDGNQERIAQRKLEIEQEAIDREERKAERAERKAEKAVAKAARAAEPKAEKVAKPKAAAAAKAGKGVAPAKPKAKAAHVAPKPARRRPAKAEATEDF